MDRRTDTGCEVQMQETELESGMKPNVMPGRTDLSYVMQRQEKEFELGTKPNVIHKFTGNQAQRLVNIKLHEICWQSSLYQHTLLKAKVHAIPVHARKDLRTVPAHGRTHALSHQQLELAESIGRKITCVCTYGRSRGQDADPA